MSLLPVHGELYNCQGSGGGGGLKICDYIVYKGYYEFGKTAHSYESALHNTRHVNKLNDRRTTHLLNFVYRRAKYEDSEALRCSYSKGN